MIVLQVASSGFGFSNLLLLIVVIAVCVALFIALREFYCWYFKINERNQLLRDILSELRKRGIEDK